MKSIKTVLHAVLATVFSVAATTAYGVLPDGTTLSIDAGMEIPICLDPEDVEYDDPACTLVSKKNLDVRGSQFIMAAGTSNESKVAVSGYNGIVLGSAQPPGNGSHTSACTGEDTGAITAPWNFFGNCGHEFSVNDGIKTSTATSDPNAIGGIFAKPVPTADGTEFLNMSNWRVTWNAIPVIDMGGNPQDCGTDSDGICVDSSSTDFAGIFNNGTALGQLRCYSDAAFTQQVSPCAAGLYYTLEHAAIVPVGDPSGFGGVLYQFRLQGTVIAAGSVIAADDTVTTTLGETIAINVLGNDEPAADLDPASVTVTVAATTGAATANADGTISYTASGTVTGADSFSYSVSNKAANATDTATVSVDVQTNVAPVAETFTAGATAGTTTNINVLDQHVADANDNIDPGTLVIVSPPSGGGSAKVNVDGTIQYTAPANPGQDLFTYQISDTGVPPMASNTATINVTVTDFACDGGSLSKDNINMLFFDAGVPGDPVDSGVPSQSGSYFTMQLSQEKIIYTTLNPGPAGGIALETDIPAAGSHQGPPDGSEIPGVDQPWNFFANTGLHYTANGGLRILDNGCIGFSNQSDPTSQGYWIVTWNGIPAIDMGGCKSGAGGNCPRDEIDLGIASIACDPAPCADGSKFDLEMAAHVPVGDPSGFGGVPYTLVLSGAMGSFPAGLTSSSGILGPGSQGKVRLTADEVEPETEASGVTEQCVGGCFDYQITGLTSGSVQVVIPLNRQIPADAQFRVFKDGAWQAFDTSTGDSVKSAPFAPGDGSCPAAGAPQYVDGLVVGNQCLLITKSDNGPNDINSASGVIADPSGIGVSTIVVPYVETRRTASSGCSVSAVPVSIRHGGDWWLLLGLLGLWGWTSRRRNTVSR